MRPAPPWFLETCRPAVRGFARLTFRIRFEGVEHVPRSGAVVITPNHASYMDPILVTIPIHRPLHYMALEPFFRVAGLGALMRWFRAFPVRESETDGPAVRTALRLLRAGEAMVIFPEGGRSPDGTLQSFRPGAFRLALAAGAPVVPVTIAGAFQAWPIQHRLPRPAPIRIVYHAPLTAADLPQGSDRKTRPALLADLVRARIAGALASGTPGPAAT